MWSLLLHGHWHCSGPRLEAIESFSHLKDTCVNRVRDLWLFLPLRFKEESFAVNKAKHPSSLLPCCWKKQGKGTERVRILSLLFWVCYLLPQTSGQVLPTWNNGSLWLINFDGFSSMASSDLFFLHIHNLSLHYHSPSRARLKDTNTSCCLGTSDL